MGARTTPMGLARPVRPSVVSSPTTTKLSTASCRSTPAKCRHYQTPRSWLRSTPAKENHHANPEGTVRMAGTSPPPRRLGDGGRAASGAPQYGELVVCLRQRGIHTSVSPDCYWHFVGNRLRAFGRPGMEQSQCIESSTRARLVFACDARVGIQLHGSRGAGAHGAGFHVRVLQVSA